GKRSAANETRLAALGIPRHLYDALLSSGEVAWCGLRDRHSPTFAGLGSHCLLFSRDGDRSAVAGLGLNLVAGPAEAEFVFLSGIDHGKQARSELRDALAVALARDLPLLCSNPDLVTLAGNSRLEGPGSFARHYDKAGGDVRWVGKPHRAIFDAALAAI